MPQVVDFSVSVFYVFEIRFETNLFSYGLRKKTSFWDTDGAILMLLRSQPSTNLNPTMLRLWLRLLWLVSVSSILIFDRNVLKRPPSARQLNSVFSHHLLFRCDVLFQCTWNRRMRASLVRELACNCAIARSRTHIEVSAVEGKKRNYHLVLNVELSFHQCLSHPWKFISDLKRSCFWYIIVLIGKSFSP